jgi:hypothetical protein
MPFGDDTRRCLPDPCARGPSQNPSRCAPSNRRDRRSRLLLGGRSPLDGAEPASCVRMLAQQWAQRCRASRPRCRRRRLLEASRSTDHVDHGRRRGWVIGTRAGPGQSRPRAIDPRTRGGGDRRPAARTSAAPVYREPQRTAGSCANVHVTGRVGSVFRVDPSASGRQRTRRERHTLIGTGRDSPSATSAPAPPPRSDADGLGGMTTTRRRRPVVRACRR